MAEKGADIAKAIKFLEHDVIGVPTETVYGLAANAFNPQLVAKIFEVKERPSFDPLIVHTSGFERISEFAELPAGKLRQLAEKFWPGPLTLLLPKKEIIPDIVTSGLPDVAVRIPSHPLMLDLLKSIPFPLAAPSANPFGYISPTTAQHVNDQLGNKIAYILDGGNSVVGVESTIVGEENGQVIIFRLGGLAVEQIENLIGKVAIRINNSSDPRAPGMLKSHYAPRKKLILGNVSELINKYENAFVIRFSEYVRDYPAERQVLLSDTGNVSEAAVNLFAVLRMADASSAAVILAETVPDEGLGKAINDRLRRAAN